MAGKLIEFDENRYTFMVKSSFFLLTLCSIPPNPTNIILFITSSTERLVYITEPVTKIPLKEMKRKEKKRKLLPGF